MNVNILQMTLSFQNIDTNKSSQISMSMTVGFQLTKNQTSHDSICF